jgi:predicted secreted acid phosphatase
MVFASNLSVMKQNHRNLLFLDIDGTVVDGTPRESLMEERGLVVGKYGEINRSYPRGYEAFINGFNDPSLFHLDTNIPEAEPLIQTAVEAGATVLFLTARDARHHCGTESDLKQRGLWRDGMRLICKPHRELIDKAEFKQQMIAMLSQGDETVDVLLVDNNRKNITRVQEHLPFVSTYLACSQALEHVQQWMTTIRSDDA